VTESNAEDVAEDDGIPTRRDDGRWCVWKAIFKLTVTDMKRR